MTDGRNLVFICFPIARNEEEGTQTCADDVVCWIWWEYIQALLCHHPLLPATQKHQTPSMDNKFCCSCSEPLVMHWLHVTNFVVYPRMEPIRGRWSPHVYSHKQCGIVYPFLCLFWPCGAYCCQPFLTPTQFCALLKTMPLFCGAYEILYSASVRVKAVRTAHQTDVLTYLLT